MNPSFTQHYAFLKKHDYGNLILDDAQEVPLNNYFQNPFRIRNGFRFDFPSPPTGCLKMKWSYSKENGSGGKVKPFSKIDGKYYFVTLSNKTDLQWEGPKDKHLNVHTRLSSKSEAKVMLAVTWNASGVSITENVEINTDQRSITRSTSFYGQHIEKITLKKAENINSLQLEIVERNGKEKNSLFEAAFNSDSKTLYQKK